jgi:hypothetical protein
VRELTARVYFVLCRTIGRLLRSARYSRLLIADEGDGGQVRKSRRFYAPILVWMGGPLTTILDTGVRVLPQRDWEQRERDLYRTLYGTSVRVDAGGVLVLPRLPGQTLAAILENPQFDDQVRTKAIEQAAVALAALHRLGLTHGDAMAENVLVDLDAGVAHWFDFETVHDSRRPGVWRRADDVRALLTTCLLRTVAARRASTLQLILDVYGDEDVTRTLTESFAPACRRPLAFHLGQAGLSIGSFREVARLLNDRLR